MIPALRNASSDTPAGARVTSDTLKQLDRNASRWNVLRWPPESRGHGSSLVTATIEGLLGGKPLLLSLHCNRSTRARVPLRERRLLPKAGDHRHAQHPGQSVASVRTPERERVSPSRSARRTAGGGARPVDGECLPRTAGGSRERGCGPRSQARLARVLLRARSTRGPDSAHGRRSLLCCSQASRVAASTVTGKGRAKSNIYPERDR